MYLPTDTARGLTVRHSVGLHVNLVYTTENYLSLRRIFEQFSSVLSLKLLRFLQSFVTYTFQLVLIISRLYTSLSVLLLPQSRLTLLS